MLRYTLVLPPPPPDIDHVGRRLCVTLDNASGEYYIALEKYATQGLLDLKEGVSAKVRLLDIDAFGNESPMSNVFVIDTNDKTPPPQPGDLDVLNINRV